MLATGCCLFSSRLRAHLSPFYVKSLPRSVRVYTVCVVSVFACLLAGWLTGARAHFEVPQHFLADTFYTRRAQHKICDSSFSAARLALIEFRLARLIVHFAEGRQEKKGLKATRIQPFFSGLFA